MKEKSSKVEQVLAEKQRLEQALLDSQKKQREASERHAKVNLEKQKQVVACNKENFKLNAEVLRLQNLNKKQDLIFHKKLRELHDKAEGESKSAKFGSRAHSKKFDPADLEGISTADFSKLVAAYCMKVCDHVQLDSEVQHSTNTLLKHHTKYEELNEEIARLQASMLSEGVNEQEEKRRDAMKQQFMEGSCELSDGHPGQEGLTRPP